MKYQFCIRFKNIDVNSAASKAVADCNLLFSEMGYKDYTLTVGDNSNRISYYASLLKQLVAFITGVKSNSIVGIQYPLLSINKVFKHFIRAGRRKGTKFFCVVHDLESLRTGGKEQAKINEEVRNLNAFDYLIVHNNDMMKWLKDAGVTVGMHSLELFDYLSAEDLPAAQDINSSVVYAGNLSKSTFIYNVPPLGRNFDVFGPNFQAEMTNNENLRWQGEYSPDEVPYYLRGSFGLIWDGSRTDVCDEVLGNYLRYNNPHKCSLYIAAGLPIIVPAYAAIAKFVTKHGIGVIIESIKDIKTLNLSKNDYQQMRDNVLKIRQKVINGSFFKDAVQYIETKLC